MSTPTQTTIAQLEQQLLDLKQELTKRRLEEQAMPVEDFELKRLDGTCVRISELFGDKRDLLLVHNMGIGCTYCTLWADGFVSHYPRIAQRAAFVLVSADPPDVAAKVTEQRSWNFPVLSGHGLPFTEAVGFLIEGGVYPGVSSFRLNDDGSITRVAFTYFGPGDDFCPVWPFFDLLPDGPNGWEPKN